MVVLFMATTLFHMTLVSNQRNLLVLYSLLEVTVGRRVLGRTSMWSNLQSKRDIVISACRVDS